MTSRKLPSGAGDVADEYPDVWSAYAALGKACAEAGPMEARSRRLVKLALAVGNRSEGAVHSHVRRGLEEGISAEELKQVAMLAVPTIGFPAAVAALTWITDITDAN
ncbi:MULTISPECIES: carboxymuconolactone decarboxylase family protein [unclassified Halomonas]|uniref:carboxymuconolactone decarboxylase family protein n=1 Tax=unclassified Halomonas TaxID=2609666 RepID=UPI0021E42053|nr:MULTISPECIES: carboxymuconolactone decarboxylase family protein [unclassified Halomonas]UYG00284.1 carboxymuconolactone decarboxylase family protein [Halomonas sp. GD1P12]WNL38637.1 carboxymuconolactone decarboxylase family protein [Halomonas sp. PAMB 3232]